MPDTTSIPRHSLLRPVIDVLVILSLSLIAESAHFTWKQGRSLVCADSLQYRDNAEALLQGEKAANFAFRKPGYSLVLAGAMLLFGSMGWGAVVVNHLFQSLVPVAAYGLGRNLHSRTLGWVAAILTIAQLQSFRWGERIMSESAYTCFLSFAVWALVVGLSRRRPFCYLVTAGVLFAVSWSLRSVAIVCVIAAVLSVVWVMRRRPRRLIAGCAAMVVPLAIAAMLEVAANGYYQRTFRTGTGTSGMMLLMRVRHAQGLPLPDTKATRTCLSWLPERSRNDAFRVNEVDTWVARNHAIRQLGLDDWQVDATMRKAALQAIAAQPIRYLRFGAWVAAHHLFRQRNGLPYSSVNQAELRPVVVHLDGRDDPGFQDNWYGYWALPDRSLAQSLAASARLREDALQRAPFGHDGLWAVLRYGSMWSPVRDILAALRAVGSLWPGFALLLAVPLGLNRRTCAFLALAYLLEACVVGAMGTSQIANDRLQEVWVAIDTTLSAAVLLPIGILVIRFVRKTRLFQNVALPRSSPQTQT